MSKYSEDAFLDLVDRYVEEANRAAERMPVTQVNAALAYAAARFAAFVSAADAQDLEGFRRQKDSSIRYFQGMYERALLENFEDYEANFDAYAEGGDEEE